MYEVQIDTVEGPSVIAFLSDLVLAGKIAQRVGGSVRAIRRERPENEPKFPGTESNQPAFLETAVLRSASLSGT